MYLTFYGSFNKWLLSKFDNSDNSTPEKQTTQLKNGQMT